MSSEGEGSVTIWIGDLKRGGAAAHQHLWARYFEQLVREARKKLGNSPRAVADEEDAAVCAFKSFFDGVRRDRFPNLADRDDLWRILVVIARRKASDLIRYSRAQRRRPTRVAGQDDRGFDDAPRDSVGEAVSSEPTPEIVAITLEETRRYLDALRDPKLQRVAVMHLQGFTADEIATHLGCVRETVQRKLKLIREEWRRLADEDRTSQSGEIRG